MRKTDTKTVPREWGGRDAGKTFLLTEWPAARAEKWGMRMILTLRGSGANIPLTLANLTMAQVAIIGLNSFFQSTILPDEVVPLMDELLECVKIVRDPKHPDVATDLAGDDDIEEIGTRLWLRSEVIKLHTGFSPADALSTLLQAASAVPGTLQNQ